MSELANVSATLPSGQTCRDLAGIVKGCSNTWNLSTYFRYKGDIVQISVQALRRTYADNTDKDSIQGIKGEHEGA